MAVVCPIEKKALVKLFKGVGSSQVSKWDDTKLVTMAKKLPGKLESMNGDGEKKTDDLDKKSKQLLEELTEAVEAGQKIKLTGTEPVDSDDAPATKKTGKKTSTKKASEKASTKVTTKKKAKSTTAKGTGPRGERGHTNKDKVFKFWLKKPTTKRSELAHTHVGEAVSLNTIRSWMSGWSRGQGLPSSAADMKVEVAAAIKKAKALKKAAKSEAADE